MMYYFLGVLVLYLKDLVNWEYVGYVVLLLDWGNKYNLNGGRVYVNGIWVLIMCYCKLNGLYYWFGCIDFGIIYVYIFFFFWFMEVRWKNKYLLL